MKIGCEGAGQRPWRGQSGLRRLISELRWLIWGLRLIGPNWDLSEPIWGLWGLIWSMGGLIRDLRQLIWGQRQLISGLRGLIQCLRGLIWGQRRLIKGGLTDRWINKGKSHCCLQIFVSFVSYFGDFEYLMEPLDGPLQGSSKPNESIMTGNWLLK